MLSPYAFYQFWLQVEDVDVVRFLKVFTFLSRERIEELERETQENPRARAAQKALAHEVTTWVHGEQETARVEAATAALWGGDADSLRKIDAFTLAGATADLPSAQLEVGKSTIIDLLVATGLEKGRGAARKTVAQGGAYLNMRKVSDEDAVITEDDLLAGGVVLVRKGRRKLAVARTN